MLTSFPSTLPVLVTSYDIVITVSKRLAGPPGDVCAGDEITGGVDMVAVALPETVDVPFMVPLAWPVPERVPVAFPGAAVGAADLAAVRSGRRCYGTGRDHGRRRFCSRCGGLRGSK